MQCVWGAAGGDAGAESAPGGGAPRGVGSPGATCGDDGGPGGGCGWCARPGLGDGVLSGSGGGALLIAWQLGQRTRVPAAASPNSDTSQQRSQTKRTVMG